MELTPAAFRADVLRAAEVLDGLLVGHEVSSWYRYPYGQADHRRELREEGFNEVGWNVDSEDYKPVNAGTGAVWRNICMRHEDLPETSIILFHTWTSGTVEDIGRIIRDLKDFGAEFGTLA